MNEAINTSLAAFLSKELLLRGETLATAESCTGGMLASLCTRQAGASRWFAGGVVAYSEQMKHELLKVPMELIDREGVVSAAVAEQMALGAQRLFHADLAIATTGIAGPSGALPHYPVGSVWVAAVYREHIFSQLLAFHAGRERFIEQVSGEALRLVYAFIQKI